MKPLKLALAVLCASAALGAAAALPDPVDFHSAAAAPAARHPELYSFVDVYRLTVAGAAMANYPLPEGRMRVAVTPSQAAGEAQFLIGGVPEPERWLLLLSGLAAAGWVARRRLGYAS